MPNVRATASVTVTTNASGDGTGYILVDPGALVLAIGYTKDGTTPYSNGVGLAVTVEATAQAVLALASGGSNMDASLVKYPRAQVHDAADGSVMTVDGTRKNVAPVPVAQGQRLKFVVNAGGNTKTGAFYALLG